MNNFGSYLTPDQAIERYEGITRGEFLRRARAPALMCEACGKHETWRIVSNGMCFTCTTGRQDASQDHDLLVLPAGGLP